MSTNNYCVVFVDFSNCVLILCWCRYGCSPQTGHDSLDGFKYSLLAKHLPYWMKYRATHNNSTYTRAHNSAMGRGWRQWLQGSSPPLPTNTADHHQKAEMVRAELERSAPHASCQLCSSRRVLVLSASHTRVEAIRDTRIDTHTHRITQSSTHLYTIRLYPWLNLVRPGERWWAVEWCSAGRRHRLVTPLGVCRAHFGTLPSLFSRFTGSIGAWLLESSIVRVLCCSMARYCSQWLHDQRAIHSVSLLRPSLCFWVNVSVSMV